jgi:2-polyprenyl-3-methyl-5-hydroxy-6-metoxy-1,4-benzoquinol methylase
MCNLLKIKKEREKLYRFKNAKIVKNRLPLIKKLIEDKNVLDIGSVQHTSSFETNPNFLFKFLTKYAKSVIGIDKEESEVNQLNEKGYNIIMGDAETIQLNKKFDVIIAGNVIEHLSNPGLFLNNMKNHLKEGGIILITTDNEGGFISFFHTLCLGYIPENPDHTMVFNYSHLRELVTREGLKIQKYYYYTSGDTPRHRSTSFVLRTYSMVKGTLLAFFLILRKNFAPGCILILTKKK